MIKSELYIYNVFVKYAVCEFLVLFTSKKTFDLQESALSLHEKSRPPNKRAKLAEA